MKGQFIVILLLFCFGKTYSQHRCGSPYRIIDLPNGSTRSSDFDIQLPLAFHFSGLEGRVDYDCLQNLVAELVSRLNEDFNGLNQELEDGWSFTNELGETINFGVSQIHFMMACHSHPDFPGMIEGQPAITYNRTYTEISENFGDYINIYLATFPYYGLSPLGGNGRDNGIRLDYSATLLGYDCLPAEVESAYGLGRTLTHEMGHYLGLNHIWGRSEACNSDDGIADTPLTSEAHYGCLSEAKSCGSPDMVMNFMDYSDDSCMYMFTKGQCHYMRQYVLTHLMDVVAKGTQVISAVVCDAPSDLVVHDENNEISISWGSSERVTQTLLAHKRQQDSLWTSQLVDTNYFSMYNEAYPETFDLLLYNICDSDSLVPVSSDYVVESFSVERPEDFFGFEWFHVYPNPTAETLTVELDLNEVGEFGFWVKLYIWDMLGNEVLYRRVPFTPGTSSTRISLDLTQLSKGLYSMRAHIDSYTRELKFVKL